MQGKEKNTKSDAIYARVNNPIGFHVEADKIGAAISVSVTGVLSIVDFSEDSALLKMRRGKIKIVGSGLSVAVYENKIVEIIGKVSSVEFV